MIGAKMRQNVTISLPADLVREARHLAVDKGLSLSSFLALLLRERIEAARAYDLARGRQVRVLDRGLPLGTGGKVSWGRDELHER
jgi:hypothetical protein